MNTARRTAMDSNDTAGPRPGASVRGPVVPLSLRSARSCGLATRFLAWRGRSGRRYVVSAHGRRALPDFAEAVLLAVAVDPTGGLRLLGVRTSEEGLEGWAALADADEIHVHLLARSAETRAGVAEDLGGDKLGG
jgi:hypothetical protein